MRNKLIISFLFVIASSLAHALPFIIRLQNAPSEIISGQVVKAYYLVTNNTATTRANNFVKYLPRNTAQVTSDPFLPNVCGGLFTLAPRGTAGDSCILELAITGPVEVSMDPREHLFVCFPGGKTCAGTNDTFAVN